MSYLKKTLLSEEKLSYQTRKHWIIFLMPLLFSILSLIFLSQRTFLVILGYLFLFIAGYYWFISITNYLTAEFVITNRRLLIQTGLIKRRTWETLLSKIATLEVTQTILGRLLNYGTLIIQNTGGGKDVFTLINHPLFFRQKVHEQTELAEESFIHKSNRSLQTNESQSILKPRERL